MGFTCVERPRKKYSVLTPLFIQTKFRGLLLRHSFSLHVFNHLIKKFCTASSIQYNTCHYFFFKIYFNIIPTILRPSKLPYTSNVEAKIACFGMVPERVLNFVFVLPIL